ncbi:Nicotinamidase-related amidase [Paenibacillus sp. 1_12]|uniref:cysteine hydrolase family protein n=1 Tax=Paenibacillus sp. 1_12 TaxID=1566278 RepID=UPI0008F36BC1|nr:cysteine hydrolase family protein [Paenibacillus sp. 1_12]SFL06221.1 Nicotinamidase-related amidase [Paenibacillus sp. 1_12]
MYNDTALLIIDVQAGMFSESPPVHQGELLISTINKLIRKARDADIQIVYVQHNESKGKLLEHGAKGWEIHPEIAPSEQDVKIQKYTPDSFHNTNLQAELDLREIKKLYITGIQSEVCVDTTCRRAFSLGYEVTLIKDAHSTWDTNILNAVQIIEHHNSVLTWFAKLTNSSDIHWLAK